MYLHPHPESTIPELSLTLISALLKLLGLNAEVFGQLWGVLGIDFQRHRSGALAA